MILPGCLPLLSPRFHALVSAGPALINLVGLSQPSTRSVRVSHGGESSVSVDATWGLGWYQAEEGESSADSV